MKTNSSLKRVSLMLREEQSSWINERQLNLSGLVRDLLDDHFSENKITLSVSRSTRELYDQVISNTGSTDQDIEHYLKNVLQSLVKDKIKQMQELEKIFT